MQNKVLIALFVLLVGFITFCMVFLMERYETTEWSGMSDEARRNPYLAAERFLKNKDVTVVKTTDVLDFATIPTDQTVLLTQVDSMLVSPRQVDAARRWIERGGYMIVGIEDELQGQTSLLNHFDITREYVTDSDGIFDPNSDKSIADQMREANRKIEEKQAELEEKFNSDNKAKDNEDAKNLDGDAEPNADDDADANADEEPETFDDRWRRMYGNDQDHEFYTLSVNGGEKIHLAVLDELILDHWLIDTQKEEDSSEADYKLNTWAGDEAGTRLLQFYYGEGTLVAMSSSRIWQNRNISLGDHAYLLTYLVPEDSTLQLFYNIKTPPFRHLLFNYFGETIWASLGFLGLWLWHRGARTKRIRSQNNSGRRNFLEHLRASASYSVRNEEFSPLIDTLKFDIEQQLRAQHPNFSTLSTSKKLAILGDKTSLSPAALESWLVYCNHIENREQFFSALQLGNAIRKQL